MKSGLTPAMRQYLDIKAQNPDSILFFRMGDFYEMFFEDAKVASRLLGIALTARDREREVPMCGVPYHAAAGYIARLVREGHKVAVCEQMTDPSEAKGIVERAVTKVITPGIALEDELLDPKANNFIAALCLSKGSCGFSYMDVSTGEFRLTELKDACSALEEIKRLRPLELLIEQGQEEADLSGLPVRKITPLGRYDFDQLEAAERLNKHFGTKTLDGFGCSGLIAPVRAAGALLGYIRNNQKTDLIHVRRLQPYFTGDFLILDSSTRRNLEIAHNLRDGGRDGTLLSVLDRTKTSMGARALKSWLLHPLKDACAITGRQDAVAELVEARELCSSLEDALSHVYDLERLIARVSLGAANPRDLSALKSSLEKIPLIKDYLKLLNSGMLRELDAGIDEVVEAAELIGRAITDSPPLSLKDGGVIRAGYSTELDELRRIGSGGKDWIAALEASERARTGINTLKVGYNRVFGYYIEITKSNIAGAPGDYIRKQTLVNAERFITPQLKEWEEKILGAEEKALKIEAMLFGGIINALKAHAERIQQTAASVAVLDCLLSLANAARELNYARPAVAEGDGIEIEGGRHPVVEANSREFVSNDLKLGDNRVIILTGPNMAGKSTYLRQNALIVLMAQIGSFVPAASAKIGAVDRIFTRVGASDDLSRGQSTFMVEMSETANILNNATSKSFVILDEIGRGTSTFDGLSIAWAVVEHILEKIGAKTLFATHYHELTELSLTKERVKNYNMAVKEWDDRIIFLKKVLPGGSSRSYGIQVARLAGIPAEVISRSKEILRNLETGELNEAGMPKLAARDDRSADKGQLSLLAGDSDPVHDELKSIDVDRVTPLEALTALHKMKELLKN